MSRRNPMGCLSTPIHYIGLMNVVYGDIFKLNKTISKKMYENFAGESWLKTK